MNAIDGDRFPRRVDRNFGGKEQARPSLFRPVVLGVALLVVIALVAGAIVVAGGAIGGDDDEPVVVRGTISTEKAGFLSDPAIEGILADRYGLRVEFATAGSLEMMETVPAGLDFLWPASPIVEEARYDPAPNSEEIFYSPIVLYSWAPVADALISAGIVQQINGALYVTGFPRLLELIESGTPWSDIGLSQIDGGVSIVTTDPTTSNSGSIFAGLLASTFYGGRLVDEGAVDAVLDQVLAFYADLGPLENSSGDLFTRFVSEGMSTFPIIAGYESSLIELSLQNEASLEQVRGEIRILYPRPTVWSSHPLIALNTTGEKLLTALQDEEIELLGWERHGFRSSLFGVQDATEVLEISGVPSTIHPVMPLPRAAVMERIVTALNLGSLDPVSAPRRSGGRIRRPSAAA